VIDAIAEIAVIRILGNSRRYQAVPACGPTEDRVDDGDLGDHGDEKKPTRACRVEGPVL
jgi:hypothetical protein